MNLILYAVYAIILYLIFMTDDKADEIIEQEETCKNCGTAINHDVEFCPHCHEGVKRACNCCGRLIDLDWRYCPFCNDSFKKII